MTTPLETRATLTVPEAARLLGMMPERLQKLVRAGHVRVVPLPGVRPMIPKQEIDRLLQGAPLAS